MESVFTAVFERSGDWWIGYVEELPGALAQEKTLEKARESLKEAIKDIIEVNRETSRKEGAGSDALREQILVGI